MHRARIPWTLKAAFSIWILVWIPVYWLHHGPTNFLWLCDIANFVVMGALLFESPLLMSSQLVGVLLIQIVWTVDFCGRLISGHHWIGGTEYMFDPASPLWLRTMSLFHLVVPVILVWGTWRLGYDRRGWILQSLLTSVLLPISFIAAPPEKNLNWLWAPFGIPQTWLAPEVYLAACILLYPLVLYYPTHRLMLQWIRRSGRTVRP